MFARRFDLAKRLVGILAVDLVALGLMLWWHWAQGPPYTQASFALMVAFGLGAALLGLSSIMIALATLHWTRRASALIVGIAIMGLFLRPLFDWDGFLIWQLIVILGTQTGCLVVALVTARLFGCRLGFADPADRRQEYSSSKAALRFSISDILIFTAAMALLFAVIRGSRPIDLGTTLYAINIAGGCAAALVGLTVLWSCLGSAPLLLRLGALVFVAPIGGVVYVLAARYASLLFSWQWYAGVTTAQVLFMAIPCLVLRAVGLRFAKGESAGG